MDNALQLFSYKDNTVRTVILDGQIWFVAKDVCDILELTNPTVAIEALDDDERSKFFLGRQGEANVISESGLYGLIFRSNKPEAKQFSKWVRSTVLPALHHTGTFSVRDDIQPVQVDPMQATKLILEAAHIKDNQLAIALDKVAKHYTGQSMLALSGIVLVAPTNNQLLTPTQIGKHFGVSPQKINELLVSQEYQRKVENGYEPLELGEPFAVMQDVGKGRSNGTPIRQLKWDSSILDELQGYFAELPFEGRLY